MRKIKIILSLILITLLIYLFIPTCYVNASSPYNTYTVNRDNEMVATQDAYEPYNSIKIIYNSLEIKNAQDMITDEFNNLFIADTGNNRGLILDSSMTVRADFGLTEELSNARGIYVVDATQDSKVGEYIYLTDFNSTTNVGRILRYLFNTTTYEVTLDKIFYSPSSWVLDSETYVYKPIKIAVSSNYYMYVTAENASAGVLMITPNNEFITYFASNTVTYSFWDKVVFFLYGDNEQANIRKQIATPPYNVMLDGSGYVYTITQSEIESYDDSNNFKKVNTGGINYFPTSMWGVNNFVDSYYGKYSNTYALSSDGYIFEYDNEGNLLFKFAGPGVGLDVYGLFSSASTITLDSNDYIYVMDNTRNNLQIFKPTIYCSLVHKALSLYTSAQYEEAEDIWDEVLRYNSMFDLAHKGVGLAYYMEGKYSEALDEFYIADDKVDYSDSYWEIRNLYLTEHLSGIFLFIILLVVLLVAVTLTNRKYHYMHYALVPFKKIGEVKFINQVFYSFNFLRAPNNTIYEIRKHKRATMLSSSVLLVILFVIYILGLIYTGFIFNNTVIENTILLNEGIKIMLPVILFIVANYLMSSLMEGEGRFRDIFTSTVGALTPIIVIYPFIIILSNVLTSNESFLYTFLLVIMFIWSGILLFMNIKETNNYSVGQTFVNILLTLFMVLILILVILILYIMMYQIVEFVADIIKEIRLR